MSAPESNYAAWLPKADNDFLNVENNLSTERVPWDTVCFHAQQAAEKLLKAFLVHHGRPLLRTHDLIALLAACVEIDPGLALLEDDCRRVRK
jgi:HEPN domain-containing protein